MVETISIAWTIVIFLNYSYYSTQKNRNSPQNRQSEKVQLIADINTPLVFHNFTKYSGLNENAKINFVSFGIQNASSTIN